MGWFTEAIQGASISDWILIAATLALVGAAWAQVNTQRDLHRVAQQQASLQAHLVLVAEYQAIAGECRAMRARIQALEDEMEDLQDTAQKLFRHYPQVQHIKGQITTLGSAILHGEAHAEQLRKQILATRQPPTTSEPDPAS